MKVYEIPGKLEVKWNSEVKSIIDTWITYNVSLEEFKEAVLTKGLNFAKSHRGVAWIVDSSSAKGAFSQEIQSFIGSEVFPAFAKIGIKYFLTITSSVSAVTKMSVRSYSAKTGPNGLKLVELNSVEDAITWLKANA
jgi:hypothetical protein